MPLANLKDAEDPERLGQILQELIITDLSELESLTVLSSQRLFDIRSQLGRTDSRDFDRVLATEIASRAGADTMLTGSLSRLGERWILACQLVSVADGAVIKSERIDGSDLYSMVDRLTAQIRDDLGLDLAAQEGVGLAVADKTTSSLEAYQHYLAGVERLNARDYEDAVLELNRAVTIDPAFGQAHYKLAVAGWWHAPSDEWRIENGVVPPEETLERLLSGEVKVPTKDRRLAEAMIPLVTRVHDDARIPFERLVEQYPDEKEAWYGLGEAHHHGENRRSRHRAAGRPCHRATATQASGPMADCERTARSPWFPHRQGAVRDLRQRESVRRGHRQGARADRGRSRRILVVFGARRDVDPQGRRR